MTERIVVVGAGGFGRETLDVIEAINRAAPEPVWEIVGVADDAPAPLHVDRLRDRLVPLLGGIEANQELFGGARYVVGIGSPQIRARLAARFEAWGAAPATLIHPAAVIGSRTSIGAGSVVCGGVQLSTNVSLGAHTHLNPGAIVGHDSVLEDFVSVNPGAIVSGEVIVRTGTLVGAGATILQGLHVGAHALIGASACVTKDVDEGATMVGVPARRLEVLR